MWKNESTMMTDDDLRIQAGLERAAFGDVLRAFRLASRMTQEELAARSGVSKRTISDLERGARRAPQIASAVMLADGLGIVDADRERFFGAGREQRAPRRRAAFAPTVLPVAPLPLFGRDGVVASIQSALAERPLVTLTGGAGVGKTRLAQAVAENMAAQGGVVAWVALDRVVAPEDVLNAIAGAIGAPRRRGIAASRIVRDALAGQPAFLVLDTMEHLLPAAPAIAALLRDLPLLHVLATSREALRIEVEQTFAIAPFPLPAIDTPPGSPGTHPAIRLVLAAARVVEPASPAEVAAAGRIARVLDGNPLALELAGAQATSVGLALTPALIEQSGLAALAHCRRDSGNRFSTMEEALAWSADRLPSPAAETLVMLGVFRGGFRPEMLAGVATELGDTDLAGGLPTLVHAGFVIIEEGRFRLLAPERLFAEQRLRASGRESAVREAHGRWFRDWARARGDEVQGNDPGPALAALDAEFANLEAAASWFARHGDADSALEIAVSLGSWLDIRGRFSEGRVLMDKALAAVHGPVDRDRLVSALFWSGQAAVVQGDRVGIQVRAHHLRGVTGAGDDPAIEALALLLEGGVSDASVDRSQTIAALRRAHAMLPEGTASFARWAVCLRLGVELAQGGDPAAARSLLEEALAIAELRGRLVEKPVPLVQYGLALIEAGDLAAAAPHIAAGLGIARKLGLAVVELLALLCAGRLLALRQWSGDATAAARILGGTLAACRGQGIDIDNFWQARNTASWNLLAAMLGAEGVRHEVAVGEHMSVTAIAHLARTALMPR
jgi:predicted ATPase/transcriptional regulator with XRE-family HTH domain